MKDKKVTVDNYTLDSDDTSKNVTQLSEYELTKHQYFDQDTVYDINENDFSCLPLAGHMYIVATPLG
jgi:hypothetical protein